MHKITKKTIADLEKELAEEKAKNGVTMNYAFLEAHLQSERKELARREKEIANRKKKMRKIAELEKDLAEEKAKNGITMRYVFLDSALHRYRDELALTEEYMRFAKE